MLLIKTSQSALPTPNLYPHCYLPWLDSGLVTKHVKKKPVIMRAAWLPSQIFNVSGNGGGCLLTYMLIVSDAVFYYCSNCIH